MRCIGVLEPKCSLSIFLIVQACGCLFLAQTASQHGIQRADLDLKCDPCFDFSQYAKGTWHAQNPIPPYMDSVGPPRASGREAKDQLKDILDEASRRADMWAPTQPGAPGVALGKRCGREDARRSRRAALYRTENP